MKTIALLIIGVFSIASYSQITYITSDVTWSGTELLNDDLVVESGNTLTLTGIIKMPDNKHIIIEQSAKLIINGGTITSRYSNFWGGIRVLGDKDEKQLTSHMGKIVLNDALIEHAVVAVALWNPGDWGSTGGIITAISSTFKNNKRDAEFMPFTNLTETGINVPNVSQFIDVTFTWDDEFRATYPLAHVTMYLVDGVQFKACKFLDERDDPYPPSNKYNCGIYSIDAQFYVLPSCSDISGCSGLLAADPDWNPSRFTNLTYGIYSSNTSSERSITVDRTIFLNNYESIRLMSTTNPTITRCDFFAQGGETNPFYEEGNIGILLVETPGLKIEENRFLSTSPSTTLLGITCGNLGENEEDFYKNTFAGNSVAISVTGKNRNIDTDDPALSGTKGLQFLCNENSNNAYDHFVWQSFDPTFLPVGVRKYNGDDDLPSGNKFSASGAEIDYNHYKTDYIGAEIWYYFNSEEGVETPSDYSDDFNPSPLFSITNTCDSRLSEKSILGYNNAEKTAFASEFFMTKIDLDNKLTEFKSLVNNGNTDSLLTIVEGLDMYNNYSIRYDLLNMSPYLTDTIIKSVINNPISIWSHSWSYELILENIEVAYRPGFMDFLSAKIAPLPGAMITGIQNKIDSMTTTDMTNKHAEISSLFFDNSYAVKQLILDLKNDTNYTDIDSIRYWITKKNDVLYKTRVIDAYIQEGNYTIAANELDSLESNISEYPNHLQSELEDFIDFKNKIVELLSNDTRMDSLSIIDYNYILNIAENGTGRPKIEASELLCFFYNVCNVYQLEYIENRQNLAPIYSEQTESNELYDLLIYPNPARNNITIHMPEGDGQYQITLTDMNGRILFNENSFEKIITLDISNLNNGNYMVSIMNLTNGIQFETKKIVILH